MLFLLHVHLQIQLVQDLLQEEDLLLLILYFHDAQNVQKVLVVCCLLILKLYVLAADFEQLLQFSAMPSVRNIRSLPVLGVAKDEPLPIPDYPAAPIPVG